MKSRHVFSFMTEPGLIHMQELIFELSWQGNGGKKKSRRHFSSYNEIDLGDRVEHIAAVLHTAHIVKAQMRMEKKNQPKQNLSNKFHKLKVIAKFVRLDHILKKNLSPTKI